MKHGETRLITGLVLSLLALSGCSLTPAFLRPKAIIDWTSFIKFNGITYSAIHAFQESPIQVDDLGPEFAKVRFMLAGNVDDPNYRSKDGDAAFLPAGTPVFTVKGYNRQFRLVAWQDGQLTLFEADFNPQAVRGGDLLDIGGKVKHIGINSETDGKTELAAIKDQQRVIKLVEIVLAASVDQRARNYGENDERYFVAFHLNDGTVVNLAFWPESGELSRGIMLPNEFSQAVRQAVQK